MISTRFITLPSIFPVLTLLFIFISQETFAAEDKFGENETVTYSGLETSLRPERQNKIISTILKESGNPYVIYRAVPEQTKNSEDKTYYDTIFLFVYSESIGVNLHQQTNNLCNNWNVMGSALGGSAGSLASVNAAIASGFTSGFSMAAALASGWYVGWKSASALLDNDYNIDLCWETLAAENDEIFEAFVQKYDGLVQYRRIGEYFP